MKEELSEKIAKVIFNKLGLVVDLTKRLELADEILALLPKPMKHTHGLGVCWCGYCGDHTSLAGTGKCYQCGKPISPEPKYCECEKPDKCPCEREDCNFCLNCYKPIAPKPKMNECCKNFFDREGLQGEMNEPMQFCPCCGHQLTDEEFAYYNKRLGDIIPKEELCGICGGNQVYIRGRHPHTDNRLVCPTCCQERLEQIRDISDSEYGKCGKFIPTLKEVTNG